MTKSIAVWAGEVGMWTMDCPYCGVLNTMTPKGDECPDLKVGPAERLIGKVECGRCKGEMVTLFWNPSRKSKAS